MDVTEVQPGQEVGWQAGRQAWNTEEEGKPQTFHFLPQLANLPQQLCIAQLRELGRLERCWLKKSWK